MKTKRRVPANSEEQFRLMVEGVRDYAIFMLDAQGYVQTWNRGAQAIKGYAPEEIIGQHFSRFYTPDAVAAGKCELELETAIAEGRFEEEGWRIRKDGSLFWANVVLTPLRDEHGGLLGFAKVTRDLTERRRAEERLRQSEERFRLMVEGVRDYAIFMLDARGYVQTWNRGAQAIKGYAPEEIIGQHFSRFYTPEDAARGRPAMLLEQAARQGRIEDEGWRVRKDGTWFWADVVITALRDTHGQLVGYAKVTRDLTERRRAEEARLRLAQAEEAVRLRDEFLSIASHELKTPLTALQLQLQSIRARMQALDTALLNKVERATRSTERLGSLVETLLDVARISTGRFTLNPAHVDLGATVYETVERLREQAQRAECTVEVQTTPGVEGVWDPLRVEQVLLNLLGNAIKYAAGTHITVSLVREGMVAVLEVADRGPGIPEQELSRIFGRFERAAPMRHFGGLGLGLYVAQQIVQAHGGSIHVRNRESGGAVFTVRLPLAPACPRAAVPGAGETGP